MKRASPELCKEGSSSSAVGAAEVGRNWSKARSRCDMAVQINGTVLPPTNLVTSLPYVSERCAFCSVLIWAKGWEQSDWCA
eukprot:6397963-Amphidinium_carterae.1